MIIESPYDDVELAAAPLHAFVLDGTAGRSARTAHVDGATGRVLTYAQLAWLGAPGRGRASGARRGPGRRAGAVQPQLPGAVAVVHTTAIRKASHNREQSQPDAAAAGASRPAADATAERPVNTQRGPRGGAPTDWFTRHPADPGSGLLRATVEGRTDDTFRYGTVAVDLLVIRSVMARTAHWSTRPARPAVASTSRSWPAQPGRVGRVRQFATSPAMPKPASPPPVCPAVITAVSRRGTVARIPGVKQCSDS